MAWHRILCPIDIHDPSTEALHSASEFCLHAPAELYVLHILEDFIAPGMAQQLTFLGGKTRVEYQAIRKQMKRLLQRYVSPLIITHTLVGRGEAAEQIIREAIARSIDLIVLSRSKRSIVEELLFPSVADTVFHHAPCPVLLVPRGQQPYYPAKTEPQLLKKHQWMER